MTTTPEPPVEVEHVDHRWVSDVGLRLLPAGEERYVCSLCGKRRYVRYECPGNDDAPREVTGL